MLQSSHGLHPLELAQTTESFIHYMVGTLCCKVLTDYTLLNWRKQLNRLFTTLLTLALILENEEALAPVLSIMRLLCALFYEWHAF